jgi:beta-N-acetylhexosaminidase
MVSAGIRRAHNRPVRLRPPRLRLFLLLAALTAIGLTLGSPGTHTRRATAQESDAAQVERIIASLTIDERVGQLVMVNFVGTDVAADSDIAALIRDFHVGSVLVTASNGNVVNRDDTAGQLATLTNGLQQQAYDATRRTDAQGEIFVPLLIATDNEGDLFPFTNVTHNYTQLPNNMTIGASWSKDHARTAGEVVGRELSAAGINMLLGPVVDVLANPRSGGAGDIGIRSFGGSVPWVGSLGRAYVQGVHAGSDGRMLTVAKHFPGHGGSDRSTDAEVPTVNKSLDQLRATDLAPFAALDARDGDDPTGTTDAMMVSHIRYRAFGAGGGGSFTRPISIDRLAFSTLMSLPEFSSWRQDHLVMADALGVQAIKDWYAQEGEPDFPNRTVVKEALMAGNDLLPLIEFYRDPENRAWAEYQLPVMQDSILYMREQYVSDPEFRRRADEALRHVIAAKVKAYPELTLDAVQVDPEEAAAVAGGSSEEMRALNDSALTLIQPASVEELRARLPRGPVSPDRVLIVECWEDCYPFRVMTQTNMQEILLRLYGPEGSGRLGADDVATISFGDLDQWLSAPDDPANEATRIDVESANWIIFALSDYNPDSRPASGAVKRFLDSAPVDVRNKNLIAIAYNAPYHLDSTEISKLAAYFAVYNKTDYAIETSFRALYGDVTPAGASPVNISGVFYDVNDAVRADPEQTITLSVFGQDAADVAEGAMALVTSEVRDRNGNPVPDGTSARVTLSRTGEPTRTETATTTDGVAVAQFSADDEGDYTAIATVDGVSSDALTINVSGGSAEPAPAPETGDGGGFSPLLLTLAIGVPAALLIGGGAAALVVASRRKKSDAPAAPVPTATPDPEPPAAPARALVVDADARRVYVKGAEAKPPLSNEQFRLLLYLYERYGKVVGREELIAHVWPDAHAEGVSEEALDALVRRVRERIVQAGGERGYIVTLRGQGFRLEAD